MLLLATGCTNTTDPEQIARPAALAVQAAEHHQQPMVDSAPANDPATLDPTDERLPPERRSDHDHFDLLETVLSLVIVSAASFVGSVAMSTEPVEPERKREGDELAEFYLQQIPDHRAPPESNSVTPARAR